MGESLFTNSNRTLHNYESFDPLLSDELTLTCQWIIFTIVCQAVDLFGIGTNIINVICFIKQGFRDPVNISLFGLAIADLGCLTTLVWTNICYTPAFGATDLPFDTIEFQYLTSGMPHTTFTRVTGWITAIITLERCLCITVPLKVKHIVTPRRVCILVVCVFVVLISSVSPLYVVNRLGMKFYPRRNKTLLGLVYVDYKESVDQINFAINNVFIPFGAFCVISICTFILVVKIQKRTLWREKSAMTTHTDVVSNRNRKVAKMVVMISTLFIVCFIPISILFTAVVFTPELSIDGKHKNIVIVIGGIGFVLESINSSVNIFIYYQMSSKYRFLFRKLFSFGLEPSSRADSLPVTQKVYFPKVHKLENSNSKQILND